MPLVNCNDCGNQVSTAATACPKCGAPVASERVSASGERAATRKRLSTPAIIGLVFVGIVVALAIPPYLERREQQNRIEEEISRIRSLPEMPIEIRYREALMGSGLVASFKNTSNRFLAVGVSLNNPSLHQNRNFRVDLAPGEVKEIGHMEGWAFSSGDTVSVSHNEYRGLVVKIP